ncbi:MAG TPA: hypothetical protein VF997_20285 [Polyangia bacterium]
MTTAGEPEFDDSRQLCDDGSCLGVVVDGKCNVCGRAANGGGDDEPAAEMVAEGGHVDDAFDDEERRLCSDGACTGLLGSDSKCKVCGRISSDPVAS